jgi:formate hydrogenlyase subunit 3/multisubunit Na+/H+ antiporter MnhD subunit
MNAAWLAAAWVTVGVSAGLGPARLRRPIALVAPLLLVALSIATVRGGAGPAELGGGGLALPREGAGLLTSAAAALWLCLLLTDHLVGGAVVLLLSTGSPLLFGVAAVLAVAALSLRWISVAPGRASLATARVAGTGAAALIAVSVLLPAVSPDGQPGLVGGLLVVGVIALTAVVPLGGWAAGALADVPPPEVAAWLVLLAPAVLLSAFAIPGSLPVLARLAFDHTILTCGLISAVWAGVMSLRAGPATRYGRVALGDIGLVVAGVGTGEAAAVAGGLLLILTHLVVAPILLQRPRPGLDPPRRLVWLAICGLPPSPAFWGRFLILQACVAFSAGIAVACLVAGGLVTVTAVLTVAQGEPGVGERAARHQVVAAWLIAAVALSVGLLPMGAVHFVFGPHA